MSFFKEIIRKLIPESLILGLFHRPRALFFAALYGFPSRKLTVIAVAGTKGKTTTAYVTAELLRAAGHRVALMSTAAVRLADDELLNAYKMTSPSPWVLQKFFADAVKARCNYAVVEVSSHALSQYRYAGVRFEYAIVTNLISDHLEYHATTKDYQEIHRRLITPKLKALVINGDDPNCNILRGFAKKEILFEEGDELDKELSKLDLVLPGDYNQRNCHAAAALTEELQVPWSVTSAALTGDLSVPGRFERLALEGGITAIVDYAHSPESLEAFFSAAVPLKKRGKIITVFGACGERDNQVRPTMGAIISKESDIVIVTNDDPYGEDPDQIADELIGGISNKHLEKDLFRILDRRQAIEHALSLAKKNDLVCVLGKGSEQYQVIGDIKRPWDDRKVVTEIAARQDRA